MLDKLFGGVTGGITGGIKGTVGGFARGYRQKDHRSSGYGFEEHRQFVSHVETEGGYSNRHARYDHHKRLPANHDRPYRAHMSVYNESDSDSDVEEFFESRRSHHTTALPYDSYNHHNGKMRTMGTGWQGQHENAYHGGHMMQHHGGHGMQHHSGHGMQHHEGYGMKHHDRFVATQIPPHHVYMNPCDGTSDSSAVVVKASEHWEASNSTW